MIRTKIIRTAYNVEQSDKDNNFEIGEYYDLETQPSLTDPSQAMEAKDILRMFSRGGTVRVLQAQNFGEEVPQEFAAIGERLHTMDKTDKAQASLDLADMVNEKTQKLVKIKTENTKRNLIAKAKAEAKAEAKKQQNPPGPE